MLFVMYMGKQRFSVVQILFRTLKTDFPRNQNCFFPETGFNCRNWIACLQFKLWTGHDYILGDIKIIFSSSLDKSSNTVPETFS